MDLKPLGSRPTVLGQSEYFHGKVWIEFIADASIPTAAKSVILTFEPGARTAWHTHPLGQTLYVLSGLGLAQRWGEELVTIRPGDTVWFPPGEKHWHGAAPGNTMAHVAIQEAKDGVTVEWLEHVGAG
jgi:quercetin dioxygenase-like cupin family protein